MESKAELWRRTQNAKKHLLPKSLGSAFPADYVMTAPDGFAVILSIAEKPGMSPTRMAHGYLDPMAQSKCRTG